MTRSECLTRFILSREYNPDAKSINYNSDLWHEERICPSGFALSIQGEVLLNSICDTDGFAWNTMAGSCNKCKFCGGESIKPVTLSFNEDDANITGFFRYNSEKPVMKSEALN